MCELRAAQTRFVILAAPRTGSNWLCSLLGSHPDILCHHEIFNPAGIFYALGYRDGSLNLGTIEERDRHPLEFLDRVWQQHLDFSCVGFKMTRGQDERIINALLDDRGIRKILLRRSNPVRTYVSEQIAEQTGRWEVYDRSELPQSSRRIRVDVEELRAHLEVNQQFYRSLEQPLRHSDQSFLSVQYERLSSPEEHARLLTFLGVERNALPLEGESIRQNPEPLPQLVANYYELESALRGTELEPLLAAEECFVEDHAAAGGTSHRPRQ